MKMESFNLHGNNLRPKHDPWTLLIQPKEGIIKNGGGRKKKKFKTKEMLKQEPRLHPRGKSVTLSDENFQGFVRFPTDEMDPIKAWGLRHLYG